MSSPAAPDRPAAAPGQPGTASAGPPRRLSLGERVRLANLSGKASAAVLFLCFLLTGLLIPMTLRLPHWIEFEIVLGCWWLIWAAVLARLLATGFKISDDYQYREPRSWFGSKGGGGGGGSSGSSWWDLLSFVDFPVGAVDLGEGCLIALAIPLVLILLFGLVWVLIEVAIPLLVFLLYFSIRGMLAHVVNDRHQCRGHLGRSLGWGTLWATVYTLPLASAVWFVHYVHLMDHARGQ